MLKYSQFRELLRYFGKKEHSPTCLICVLYRGTKRKKNEHGFLSIEMIHTTTVLCVLLVISELT